MFSTCIADIYSMANKTKYDLADKAKMLNLKMLAIPAANWEAFKIAFYRYAAARDQYIKAGGCLDILATNNSLN